MEIQNIVEVKLVDGKVVGYLHGKKVTEQNSIHNALVKLAKYVKGQS